MEKSQMLVCWNSLLNCHLKYGTRVRVPSSPLKPCLPTEDVYIECQIGLGDCLENSWCLTHHIGSNPIHNKTHILKTDRVSNYLHAGVCKLVKQQP